MTNTTATSAAAVRKTVMDDARRAIPETPEELWLERRPSGSERCKERTSDGIGWLAAFRSELFRILHFK